MYLTVFEKDTNDINPVITTFTLKIDAIKFKTINDQRFDLFENGVLSCSSNMGEVFSVEYGNHSLLEKGIRPILIFLCENSTLAIKSQFHAVDIYKGACLDEISNMVSNLSAASSIVYLDDQHFKSANHQKSD